MRLDEAGLSQWGRRIGETLRPPAFLGLQGPLGAGKSVLARAIGDGAGVGPSMPSPSYNLVFRYPSAIGHEGLHLDLYRIESSDELWELGWDTLGMDHEIVLVEWPERAGDMMPGDHWLIQLDLVPGSPALRDVSVHRIGTASDLAPFPVTAAGA